MPSSARILTLLDLTGDLGSGGEVEELVGGAVGTVDALHLVQHVALRQHLVQVVPHVGAVRRGVAEGCSGPRHRQAARPLRVRPVHHADSHHHQRRRHRHGRSAHLHRDRIWLVLHPGNNQLCPNLNRPKLQ